MMLRSCSSFDHAFSLSPAKAGTFKNPGFGQTNVPEPNFSAPLKHYTKNHHNYSSLLTAQLNAIPICT